MEGASVVEVVAASRRGRGHALSARKIFSAVIGSSQMRTPTAAYTALAIAGRIGDQFHLQRRYVEGTRQLVVAQAGGRNASLGIKPNVLHERRSEALDQSTAQLTVDALRIEHRSDVEDTRELADGY